MKSTFALHVGEHFLDTQEVRGKTCTILLQGSEGTVRTPGCVVAATDSEIVVEANIGDFTTVSENISGIYLLFEGEYKTLAVESYQIEEVDAAPITAAGGTQVETVLSDVHWDQSYSMGIGVDALTNRLCRSAVKITAESAVRPSTIKTDAKIISTAYEYSSTIEGTVSGHYNTGTVDFKGSLSYLNDVKFSKNSLSMVLEYTAIDACYGIPDPSLTQEAVSCLNDSQKFREVYGGYFISDVKKGSRFIAVYNFTSSSEEKLSSFKASLSAESNLYGAAASASIQSYIKSNNIETRVSIYYEGCNGIPSLTSTADITDIAKALSWFTSHLSPVSLFAKLTHY